MLFASNNLAESTKSFWLPPQSSSYAADIDWLFWFIFYICVIFFLLVAVLVVVFAWKYRYQPGKDPGDAPKHNTALELTWTFVPTVLVVIIFVYGFKGYLRMTVPPPNCYEIIVNGRTWSWSFIYPNGHEDTELHVPQGVPVQFVLTSNDVIHGFYMPAFRVKKDVVPGRYNKIWAEGIEPGETIIYCTQYCGDKHSEMRAKLVVEPSMAAFKKWLEDRTAGDVPADPVAYGKLLYVKKGCVGCHNIDGKSGGTGPTWKDLFGHDVEFNDGTHITADEDYLRSMIVNPNNRIVKGFNPIMPSFQGQLKDKTHDVDALIWFIKSNSDKFVPPTTAPASQPTTGPAATQPATTPAQ